MIKRFPIIRPAVRLADVLNCLRCHDAHEDPCGGLAQFCKGSDVFLVNSGLAAFYLVLRALQRGSDRKEVILPAYTAGSLIVAIRKAGLVPVLCDVSLEDFNSDRNALYAAVSPHTLAAVAIHIFGIPMFDIAGIKTKLGSDVYLVEDCAQAMGSRVNDLPVGCFGDVSFWSFNRGKNFTTFGGGALAANKEALLSAIIAEVANLAPQRSGALGLIAKSLASAAATDPFVYGMLANLLARFKETAPPRDVEVARLDKARAALGKYLLPRSDNNFLARYQNSAQLFACLKGANGIRLPRVDPAVFAVFNRLPVLFDDVRRLKEKQHRLWEAGFESSRMYEKPLHHMFDLGYKKEDFPNAVYCAEHLLTLPVYQGLAVSHLERIAEVIRQ